MGDLGWSDFIQEEAMKKKLGEFQVDKTCLNRRGTLLEK